MESISIAFHWIGGDRCIATFTAILNEINGVKLIRSKFNYLDGLNQIFELWGIVLSNIRDKKS